MKTGKIKILDGATGTMLNKMGMPKDICTERFILENPDVFRRLQSDYIEAGSDAVLAPTFGANTPSLTRHGFSEADADEICSNLARISLDNAAGKALVGGDISPTGMLLKPYGNAEPDEVFAVYKTQAESCVKAGVDFIIAETMISAAEAVIAARAVRAVSSDIPLLISLTVNENGRTMSGDSLEAALIILSQYNIQGFGCNCSIGPDVVYNALLPVSGIAKKLGIPLIAKPNAGLPVEDENGTHFPLTPDDMAEYVEKFVRIGVGYLGGCCGTTPEHIRAIKNACEKLDESIIGCDAVSCDFEPKQAVANLRKYAVIDPDAEYVKISDEDELYDAADEADEVLYLELEEGAGDIVISEVAYLTTPVALKGSAEEIEKVRNYTSWKVD